MSHNTDCMAYSQIELTKYSLQQLGNLICGIAPHISYCLSKVPFKAKTLSLSKVLCLSTHPFSPGDYIILFVFLCYCFPLY